jgi:hypothetical protein
MFGFGCRHKFVEVERFHAPPRGNFTIQNATRKQMDRLMLGVTTIVSKCSLCGKLDTTEVLGKKAE